MISLLHLYLTTQNPQKVENKNKKQIAQIVQNIKTTKDTICPMFNFKDVYKPQLAKDSLSVPNIVLYYINDSTAVGYKGTLYYLKGTTNTTCITPTQESIFNIFQDITYISKKYEKAREVYPTIKNYIRKNIIPTIIFILNRPYYTDGKANISLAKCNLGPKTATSLKSIKIFLNMVGINKDEREIKKGIYIPDELYKNVKVSPYEVAYILSIADKIAKISSAMEVIENVNIDEESYPIRDGTLNKLRKLAQEAVNSYLGCKK